MLTLRLEKSRTVLTRLSLHPSPAAVPTTGAPPDDVGDVGRRLFVGATIYTMLGYVVLCVEDVVGAGSAVGGVVLALTPVIGSAGRVAAGSLVDRVGGPRWPDRDKRRRPCRPAVVRYLSHPASYGHGWAVLAVLVPRSGG